MRIKLTELVSPMELELEDGEVHAIEHVNADSLEDLQEITVNNTGDAASNKRAYDFVAKQMPTLAPERVRKLPIRVIVEIIKQILDAVMNMEKNSASSEAVATDQPLASE